MNLHLAACFLCMAAFSSAAANIGHPKSCCLRTDRGKIPLDKIVDYRWQNKGLCPITAVIFYTQRGRRFCADHLQNWTRRAISKVDGDRKSKTDSLSLTTGSPAVGNGDGVLQPTETRPVSDRWLQGWSAVSEATKEQHKAEESAKAPQRPGKDVKRKRKGKGKGKGKTRVRQRKAKKTK